MKKYVLVAVALFCLTTPSLAQDRVEAPALSKDVLETSAAPRASPSPHSFRGAPRLSPPRSPPPRDYATDHVQLPFHLAYAALVFALLPLTNGCLSLGKPGSRIL